jgi:long-chain acyl-CoA synthetase
MTEHFKPGGSLGRLLQWRASERPDLPFLWVEEDGPWTLARLTAASVDLRERLLESGVRRGDRVLVRIGNDERFLPCLAAAWLIGAVAVAMHPATPEAAAREAALEMEVRAVLCPPGDLFTGSNSDPGAAEVLPVDPIDSTIVGPPAIEVPDVSDAEAAVVLLTSGSTGKPKGVALSHGNLWANLRSTVLSFSTDGDPKPLGDRLPRPNLIANPLSHTGGMIRLLIGLYSGRPLVLLRKFEPVVAKRAVDRHGINNLTINPSMMKMLLDGLPAGEDLGPVKYVSSGTAPLAPALREAFEDRFSVPVLQSYGQTEVSGAIAIEDVRDVLAGKRRPGSVGKPLPGMEVRIFSTDDTDVPTGGDGEIVVRSKATTIGYLGDAGSPPVDSSGWLRTGDIGHLDADGYLYVTGRLRHVIICGGFNVIPEEVEAAVIDGTYVLDAAVVALPDDRLGEIPVAVVEPAADTARVMERAGERLAPFKRPRMVFSVDALPRLPIGKVDKAAVTRLAERLARESESGEKPG